MEGEQKKETKKLEEKEKSFNINNLFNPTEKSTMPFERFGNQLNEPLDPNTKRLIRRIVLQPITYKLLGADASTSTNYGTFFVASKPFFVEHVTQVHGQAGTDVGDVMLQIERLQNTETPGSGDDLLQTSFDLKDSAENVHFGNLVVTDVRVLQQGDRLSLSTTGTLTDVENVVVTVLLREI